MTSCGGPSESFKVMVCDEPSGSVTTFGGSIGSYDIRRCCCFHVICHAVFGIIYVRN